MSYQINRKKETIYPITLARVLIKYIILSLSCEVNILYTSSHNGHNNPFYDMQIFIRVTHTPYAFLYIGVGYQYNNLTLVECKQWLLYVLILLYYKVLLYQSLKVLILLYFNKIIYINIGYLSLITY